MPAFDIENLKRWTAGEWSLRPSQHLSGICHDTRNLKAGELYVAIRGERFDGHDFVGKAFESGAVAALVEETYPTTSDFPLLRVADTRDGLSAIARGHRADMQGTVCGITGSVGKTTVKALLAGILSRMAPTASTPGNWNNDIGLPLSMLAMESDDRYGVFEIGMNRPGEIASLADLLQPDCGIMTTVGMAHSEQFATVEDIAREKAAMLTALPRDGFAVLAGDEEWFELFAASTEARICTVAIGARADYEGELDAQNNMLTIHAADVKIDVRLPVPGVAFSRNAILAAGTALELGVAAEAIVDGIESFQPLPMRWNESSVDGIDFINDAYNANPVSMRSALKTFSDLQCSGQRWVVLGGMRELGDGAESAHIELGMMVPRTADWLIAVGEYGGLIARGALDEGMGSDRVYRCESCCEVADILHQKAQAGDMVLLKASRMSRLEQVLSEFDSRRSDRK